MTAGSGGFRCYEFLLLQKLQSDEQLWLELKEKILKGESLAPTWDIAPDRWFLALTIDRVSNRFVTFVKSELERDQERLISKPNETILNRYINSNAFVELRLDNIFKHGEVAELPRELFRCPSVRHLSLKFNFLEAIPPDIGQLQQLEHLALTNNKLQNHSIPFTLTFCRRLQTLLLDNNLLDALPGFLLSMRSLQTVHRHGNHNYFKATFMWYHTDFNDRILRVSGSSSQHDTPDSLQFLSAKAVIASKINFYCSNQVAQLLKDYIAGIYSMFIICGNCHSAQLNTEPGYKVYTFKNPYLGNTCVPFQHWACSLNCAKAIEIPAHMEQRKAAKEQDRQYDLYVHESRVKCGCYHQNSAVETSGLGSCVLL